MLIYWINLKVSLLSFYKIKPTVSAFQCALTIAYKYIMCLQCQPICDLSTLV